MPQQRPGLSVNATPVSTFVAPQAAAAELYDAQSVNLALQFSDAFKELSLSAANFYSTLKTQSNKENLQAGIDLVNKNQKSYQDLVDSGEIKPAENPWLAVGAQQASGTMEGMRARSHFMSLYNQAAESDPKFFDNADGFNAMAHQYTENMNTKIGDRAYLSRSFYEAFNPFIASTGMEHEQRVTEKNQQRVTMGVGAVIAQAWQDMDSPDPIVRQSALNVAQFTLDDMSRKGVSPTIINQTASKNIIELMTKGKKPEHGYQMFKELRSGTGALGDTEFAKYHLEMSKVQIEANRQTNSLEDLRAATDVKDALVKRIVDKSITEEEAIAAWRSTYTENTGAKLSPSFLMGTENSISTESAHIINKNLTDTETAKVRADREEARATRLSDKAETDIAKEKLNTLQELELKTYDSISAMGPWQGDEKENAVLKDALTSMRDEADRLGVTAATKLTMVNRVEGLFTIRHQAARAEIALQKEKAAEMSDFTNNTILDVASNPPVELMNPLKNDELTVYAKNLLDVHLENIKAPADVRMKATAKLMETLKLQAGVRETAFNISQTSELWSGNPTTGTAGLGQRYAESIDKAFAAGEVPDVLQFKSEVDALLRDRNIESESDKAKPIYSDAYGKLDAIVESKKAQAASIKGFGGTLNDLPSDTPEVSMQKATFRPMFQATKLTNAIAFNNGQEGARIQKTILMAASSFNEGNLDPNFVDAVKAVDLASRQNMPWYLGSGDSANAKAVNNLVDYVTRSISDGATPQNAMIDGIHRLTAQRGTKFNFFDPENPMMWTNVTGSGTDSLTIQKDFLSQVNTLKLTQSDSLPFYAILKSRTFNSELQKNPDITNALANANKTIAATHVVFRGSLIPNDGLPPKQGVEYVQAFLDAKFPGKNATLVPIQRSGSDVYFAIRDGEGNMIPGAGGLISKQDMKLTPEIIKAMNTQRTDAKVAADKSFNETVLNAWARPPRD